MDGGFPKMIQHRFPGIGSRVDAAFENYGEFNTKNKQNKTKNTGCSINHYFMLFPVMFFSPF